MPNPLRNSDGESNDQAKPPTNEAANWTQLPSDHDQMRIKRTLGGLDRKIKAEELDD